MWIAENLPRIVQGGMGVGVSSWRLASAVAAAGQLGVVSGVALDVVLTRRLQDGDPDGAARRALAHFPNQAIAERIVATYLCPTGRPPGRPYRPVPKLSLQTGPARQELAVAGSFVEVWLAKQGHGGLIGINCLEKIQLATPAAALGAMLAGVDVVLVGAGIPRELPLLLDDLAAGRPGAVTVDVHGSRAEHRTVVDPVRLLGGPLPALRRPRFLAVVSTDALAAYLARDERTRPDGFVLEGPSAGGHNAPPRGRLTLDHGGEPVYGPRDHADPAKVAGLGLPFWLAGGYDSAARLQEARAAGATGVQVGTLFALAEESGLEPGLRRALSERIAAGTVPVRTDPKASPTGFPFKVVHLPGTLAEAATYDSRRRICDLGFLRTPHETPEGRLVYRCPSEPVHLYVRKGGDESDTVGRQCLCNALLANVGLGQLRPSGAVEPALLTLGAHLDGARRLATGHPNGWTANDVIADLLGPSPR
jgi:NAD(P)H-dependent flavin oxidoreductase YrpB (nitropropane dioxygenase family)